MGDPRAPVLTRLHELAIPFELHEHPPVFTADEAAQHWTGIEGTAVKNLFLRNKKGDRHYLVVLGVDKQVDLRSLVQAIGDDRLSFASPERLMTHLGVTPGSVSPLGLVNDRARAVRVIVDADLKAAARLIFHPNDNSASVTIAGADFVRFLEHHTTGVRWIRL